MKNDINLKILWLSDIHFSSEYNALTETEVFKNYFSHFRTKIETEHIADSPIEYIFLTGDLAQSGSKGDYDLFWSFFLKPLLDIFLNKSDLPLPKVITIPGNHDVKWDNAIFFKDYLENIIPSLNEKILRSDYLAKEGNEKNFRTLFTDYQNFLCSDVKESDSKKYIGFFEFDGEGNSEFIVSDVYKDTKLYGYIIDKKRKAIFILFNTAWFSLGDKFNDLFAGEIVTNQDFDTIKTNNIDYLKSYINKEILKKKDSISEFSNQVTGVNFIECDTLYNYFTQYPDFLIVSCMHHPLNWLEWDEYYTYDESNKELNANKLGTILNKSDILLSGHEHIPLDFSPEKIYSDTIHLKSGCFLFDNQHTSPNLSYSWFSILSIDTEHGILSQKKYFFDSDSKKNNWEVKEEPEILLLKKNDRYSLTPERKATITSQISSLKEDKLLTYIKTYISHGIAPTELITIFNEKDAPYSVYTTAPKETGEIYIVSQKSDFYSNINNEKFFEYIEQLMQSHDYKLKIFRFVVLDLFIDGPLKKEYDKSESKRQQVLQQIVKRADSLFDGFRHSFFVRFEAAGSSLPVRIERFKKYNGLCFVNHIIPYWVLEKNWS